MFLVSKRLKSERGVALLITIFVVSLATVIVLDLGYRTRFDQRAARAFSEGIQAEYALKSEINLARVILEIPKPDDQKEDWMGEEVPWVQISRAPVIPVDGFIGEPRITIVDEEGKIDINALASGPSNTSTRSTTNSNSGSGNIDGSNYWKNALSEIFTRHGFVKESYKADSGRTIGDIGYDASDQVAIIHDWIDEDSVSHSNALFDGDGIESGAPQGIFFNRPLHHLSELLLVPGFTMERLQQISPFIRVGATSSRVTRRVNVNTAPPEVLLALGFPETHVTDITEQRLNLPITQEILNTLVEGDLQLRNFTKVNSSEFGVYGKVTLPNSTHWVKANIRVRGQGNRRRATVQRIEFH